MPPSTVPVPPAATVTCRAPRSSAAWIAYPTPTVPAAMTSRAASSTCPALSAISTTARPPLNIATRTCSGRSSASTVRTSKTSAPPAAITASSVPSPPSASGISRASTLAALTPRASAAAASAAVAEPRSLSGQQRITAAAAYAAHTC